jgi:hypothetical protein
METLAPVTHLNTLFWNPSLATASTRVIVAPNHDTMYCVAVLDLAAEPLVLTIPAIHDRYFVFQFLSAWTDAFGYVGTRATGGDAGSWAIVPPGFTGTLPPGVQKLQSTTNQAFLLGRFRVVTAADIASVMALSNQVTLETLSAFTGTASPGSPPMLASPPGSAQTVGSDGATFFDELGDALPPNLPVTAGEQAELAGFAPLGVGPGKHPSTTLSPSSATYAALTGGVTDGLAALADPDSVLTLKSGWEVPSHAGVWGDGDILLRAVVASYLWGANVAEESVYLRAAVSAEGQALDGSKSWVVHFAANELPPVSAFWSVTLYGPDMFFFDNPQNVYDVSGDTPGLQKNADGSLDVLVQGSQPATMKANWIPSPSGPFYLMLRLYLPGAAVLNGTWPYPSVSVAP